MSQLRASGRVRPTIRLAMMFFFNDTATTAIYTLSLHDALPISHRRTTRRRAPSSVQLRIDTTSERPSGTDRKSTRLNSSHPSISYAVFCLKKKTKRQNRTQPADTKRLSPSQTRLDAHVRLKLPT